MSYSPQVSIVITKERKAIEAIKKQYLQSNLPLSVGFSGGKDSTVTLDLVFKALMEIPEKTRTKKTYVIFSDTLLEMDPVIKSIDDAINNAIEFSQKNNLNVEIKRAKPANEETLFSLMIGKGYTPPRRDSAIAQTD